MNIELAMNLCITDIEETLSVSAPVSKQLFESPRESVCSKSEELLIILSFKIIINIDDRVISKTKTTVAVVCPIVHICTSVKDKETHLFISLLHIQ